MPSQARLGAPGVLLHVIFSSIERQRVVFDVIGRDDFFTRLSAILPESTRRHYAWALIPKYFDTQW